MSTHARSRSAFIFAVILLAISAGNLWALDLADGRIRLVLNESNGHFSLSGQTKGSSATFLPLLASQDMRTTTLSILVGNKIYRMGDGSEFSLATEKTTNGGRFTWKSSFLQVTETFTFTASTGSTVTDGIQIDIDIKNLSEQNQKVGVRYLFDTYLGEPSFVQFRTDTMNQLSHELGLTAEDQTAYWVSPLVSDPDNFGLQVMTSGQGVTVPDRVVFANWKRLNDSSWSFDVATSRNFNLLPYSVNDSAACQYYNPRTLARAGSFTVTLALGVFSRAGFTARAVSSPASTGDAQKSTTTAISGLDTAVHADLATVNRILTEIDQALAAGTPLTAEKLAVLESALQELSGRASGYVATPEK